MYDCCHTECLSVCASVRVKLGEYRKHDGTVTYLGNWGDEHKSNTQNENAGMFSFICGPLGSISFDANPVASPEVSTSDSAGIGAGMNQTQWLCLPETIPMRYAEADTR
jgi:hypothetical protein